MHTLKMIVELICFAFLLVQQGVQTEEIRKGRILAGVQGYLEGKSSENRRKMYENVRTTWEQQNK